MASVKAKMLEGYLDELNQSKPKTTTTPNTTKTVGPSTSPSIKASMIEGYLDEAQAASRIAQANQGPQISSYTPTQQMAPVVTPQVSQTPPVVAGNTYGNGQQNNQGANTLDTNTYNTGLTDSNPSTSAGSTSYTSQSNDQSIIDLIKEFQEAQKSNETPHYHAGMTVVNDDEMNELIRG